MTAKKMTLTAIVLLLAVAGVVQALVRLGGNRPIRDQGWPAGSVRMANLRTRISWRAGEQFRTGGMYEFEYHAENTEQFNKALRIFAAIDANRLELIVHTGPRIGYSRRDKSSQSKDRIDWTFTVWNPGDRNNRDNPQGTLLPSGLVPISKGPVPPPRIDVYIGAGAVVWKQVKVPENVVLIDKRPESVSPEFAGKGLIRAEVFDMETKEAIHAARIVLLKAEEPGQFKQAECGKTAKKGYCQIAHIPLSFYEIRVFADGYVARKWGYWDNERPEFLQFKIGLSRPACVAGIVVDTDGKPIEGASLWVTDVLDPDGLGYSCVDEPTSTADAQGRFEMCSLPKGSMSPRCRFEGLHFTNSILDQHKVPSDGIKLVMVRTATIWGKVVDRKGNTPPGETILELEAEGVHEPGTWYCGSHGFDVDPNGTFNISGIPPGRYLISTRPNPCSTGYEPSIGKITVEGGKTYEMEVLHEDLRDRVMNKVRKFIERKLNHGG